MKEPDDIFFSIDVYISRHFQYAMIFFHMPKDMLFSDTIEDTLFSRAIFYFLLSYDFLYTFRLLQPSTYSFAFFFFAFLFFILFQK